ncbi:MAG: DUF4139 domain-containing protein [Alphaproteobacteria bacterium]|nr:DUF4139 domain-containing protein [Alphaproteobacteria bacterium]
MSVKRFLLFFGAVCLTARTALAAATVVSPDSTKSLNVTVYNNGLGLIKDTRSISFKQGENALSFQGVSAQIQPETALFDAAGVKVLEQNFYFDLLSRDSLLRKFLGKNIQVIETHYISGKKTIENAKVLSVDAGLVLQIGDRIETEYTGRLIFPDVPADLYDQPTLTFNVMADQDGTQEVELSYLTNGLTWRADYVAELNDTEDKINLNGWVTLTNTSGIAYKNANIQFVAGSVNRIRPVQPRPMMMKAARSMAMMDNAAVAEGMTEEQLMDYHLYSLGRMTDIASNQTKQLALLSASGAKVQKEYKFVNIVPTYRSRGNFGEFPTRNAEVVLKLDNDKASNLGLSLPGGIIRVYKADAKHNTFFVGEDRIPHTPENGKIKLNLGSAFDVTVQGKETAYTAFSDKAYEAGYSLTFKNATDKPVKVTYQQDFPNQWSITDSPIPYRTSSSRQAEWTVEIPAKGQNTLNYMVRVKSP